MYGVTRTHVVSLPMSSFQLLISFWPFFGFLLYAFLCPTSVFTKPHLPTSFNRVVRVILYLVHDYSALVTSEALSRFPFQPWFVEDVVLKGSGTPVIELVGGTIEAIFFFFSFLSLFF